MATHLLIETGRASRLAACDMPRANGEPGVESLDGVTCRACLAMFGRPATGADADTTRAPQAMAEPRDSGDSTRERE